MDNTEKTSLELMVDNALLKSEKRVLDSVDSKLSHQTKEINQTLHQSNTANSEQLIKAVERITKIEIRLDKLLTKVAILTTGALGLGGFIGFLLKQGV